MMRRTRRLCLRLGLVAWLAVGNAAITFGEGLLMEPEDHPLLVFSDYNYMMRQFWTPTDAALPSRTPRLQFFRMPSAGPGTPLGLYPDEDTPPEDGKNPAAADDGSMQFVYGAHIPYLDMYRKGDPGGFGFYKVHSQVQIFDVGSTSISAVVQAVTPMGLENGGVNSGKTIMSPALACFQELGDGAALHAFVGQDLCTSARSRDQWQAGCRYGLALQQAVPLTARGSDQGVFVFVQALGQYQTDTVRADGKTSSLDVVPGIQYRVNGGCWMAVGISRYSYLSWVWQY